MSSPSDIYRHPDGSIDFDRYRREASRQRAEVLRATSCRIAAAFGRVAAAFGIVAPRKLPRLATR